MTQPHNKQPQITEWHRKVEYFVKEGRLSWELAYSLLRVEAILMENPEGAYAELLVERLQG